MTRNKLIAITNLAAFKAHMSESDRQRLVAAVSDPNVHHIAYGSFTDGDGAYCPLSLSGIFPGENLPTPGEEESQKRFWRTYDSMMTRLHQSFGPFNKSVEVVG